jgi:hypothetical protein
VRRADRGLKDLIPDQRPAQGLAPEVPDLPRAVARQFREESAAGKPVAARPDYPEVVALGVREHNVTLLRPLVDVNVPGTQAERPRDRLLLIFQAGARQMEMPRVQAGFPLLSWKEPEPESRVIARHERNAVASSRRIIRACRSALRASADLPSWTVPPGGSSLAAKTASSAGGRSRRSRRWS